LFILSLQKQKEILESSYSSRALAGQMGGAIHLSMIFLLLFHQGKKKK
jgi:hypothetical protein